MVGALATAGIARMWPHEPLLMEVAHPVVRIDPDYQNVCWLSSHQLLIVTTSNSDVKSENWRGEAEIFDTTLRTRNRLTSLTNLMLRTTADPMDAVGNFVASPDGKWLLWEAYCGHGAAPPSIRVAHVDGTHYRVWDYDESNERFFLDSDHLVQMRGWAPWVVISDLQDSRKVQKYQTLTEAQEVLTRSSMQHPFWIEVDRPDEFSEGYAAIQTYRAQDRIQPFPEGREEKEAPKPFRTQRLRLPPGAEIEETIVSTQQQSILYDFQIVRQNPLLSWLHRFLPRMNAKSTLHAGLWVSRADRSGMREIGVVPLQSAHDVLESNFHDVCWLPGGKQVSFVYNGMLYIVSAEPEK